jgi:hypothetical protein
MTIPGKPFSTCHANVAALLKVRRQCGVVNYQEAGRKSSYYIWKNPASLRLINLLKPSGNFTYD